MQLKELSAPRSKSIRAVSEPKTPLTPRRRSHRLRRRLVAIGVALALLFAVGGTAGYAYTSLKRQVTDLQAAIVLHLNKGQSGLEAGRASLKLANSNHDGKLIQQSKSEFANAKTEFLAASLIADRSSLLKQAEGWPSIGQTARSQHRAVDGVSAMGVQLALAGGDLSDLDGQILTPPPNGQEGRTLLTMLIQVQSKIDTVRAELTAALTAADRVDRTVLPRSQLATFERAKGTIAVAIEDIDQFKALVPILTEVLGGNGARTYLVEQVNPAELRPGGGFLGTYSIMRADHGNLSLIESGNAADVALPRPSVGQPGYVTPPAPFEHFIPGTSWTFIDSNFFADFPSNAAAGINFAQSRLGLHIDAVISIDYFTVSSLLSVTGDIAVPGYHLTLTASNFIPTVVQYDIAASTDPAAAAEHKAILSAAAGPLLQRLVSLPSTQWPALIGTLNALAAERHLQVFFNNGEVENSMNQYGWSGIPKVGDRADYMMEVEANLGGTKANYYVTRNYTIELTRNGSTLHHNVIVDIKDDMPYAYRPGEFYRAYIRMFVSDKASTLWSDLASPYYPSLTKPPGTKMLDGWISIHGYGHDRVVNFQWDTPWTPDRRGVEQIYWQKQPGTALDKVEVVWSDGSGHTYKVSGDLGEDRVITLGPHGASLIQGQIGTAQLPSLSLG